MPWHIGTHEGCPDDEPVAVIKDDDGSLAGCHANQADAERQLAALYANEEDMSLTGQRLQAQLPGAPAEPAPPGGPTWAMVAWIPPPDVAAQLAVDGEGAEPPERLHCTLVYLGAQATLELDRMVVEAVVADVASDCSPKEGTVGGLAVFGPEQDSGNYPLVATLDVPGLDALRTKLVHELHEHLDFPEDTHGFVPHVTLAYLPEPPAALPPLPEAAAIQIGEVTVCWGDDGSNPDALTPIPLTGGLLDEEEDDYDPAEDQALTASVRAQFQVDAPPALSEVPQWKALVVVEGKPTDDFRNIEPGALRARQTPLPLMWTGQTSDNHDGSERAGTITRLWKDGNAWRAEGVYVDTPAGRELQRQTEAGIVYWPSVDIGGSVSIFEQRLDGSEVELIVVGVIVGFTDVSMPAQEGTWFLPIDAEEPEVPAAGPTPEPMAASAAPLYPPERWFRVPAEVDDETPLAVDATGRIFGHVAGSGCHVGLAGCVRVPADVDYSMFNDARGTIRTAEGLDVRVGPVTLVGGHAPLRRNGGPLGYQAATAHYDDTASTVAYGRVGPTRVRSLGGRVLPWFSGVLRPDATEDQVHALRAHGVSGDWRPYDGRTTLAAVLSVPVPGLPVRPKALVASGRLEAIITSSPMPAGEEEDMDLATFKGLYDQMVAEEADQPAEDPPAEPKAEEEDATLDLTDERFAELHAKAHEAAAGSAGSNGDGEPKEELAVQGEKPATLQEGDAAPPPEGDSPPSEGDAGGPPADLVAAFQAGNIGPLLDWYCTSFPWGQEGAHTACVETAAGHVDDAEAFCTYVSGICGASLEVPMTPELLVASMAAKTVRDRFHGFYAPDVSQLRERMATAANGSQ